MPVTRMATAIFFILVMRNPSVSRFGDSNVALANTCRTTGATVTCLSPATWPADAPSRGRLPEAGSQRLVHLLFQMIDLLAQPIVLSLEAIMLALRLVAPALGAFRPFSQVFDLTSAPIVQGWVA